MFVRLRSRPHECVHTCTHYMQYMIAYFKRTLIDRYAHIVKIAFIELFKNCVSASKPFLTSRFRSVFGQDHNLRLIEIAFFTDAVMFSSSPYQDLVKTSTIRDHSNDQRRA